MTTTLRPAPHFSIFSPLYGGAVTIRNWLYDRGLLRSRAASLPVISVGNVVAGGSGKSPFTRYIVERLVDLGHRPAILSRGYGGAASGPLIVSASHTALEVGDEPLMQFRYFRETVPVVVSRARGEGAALIARCTDATAIVLDDGFQHRALRRDLDMLLFSGDQSRIAEWQSGRLLPGGWLREPLRVAAKRADLTVLVRKGPQPKLEVVDGTLSSLRALFPNRPALRFFLHPDYALALPSRKTEALAELPKGPIAVLTGIADPLSFKRLLEGLGFEIVSEMILEDHADLGNEDVTRWLTAQQAPVWVTEKDSVKLHLEQVGTAGIYVLLLAGSMPEEDADILCSAVEQTLRPEPR